MRRSPGDGSPGYVSNITGVINTITESLMEKDSQNSRRRTYRQANPNHVEASFRFTKTITYGPGDPVPTVSSSHEVLVIELLTNNYIMKKVYVDPESSVDVMYYRTFECLKLTRDQLVPVKTPLVGFEGHVVHSEGMITLTVTVGQHLWCRIVPVNFVVVKADSTYNLLMGQPILNALRAVYSTYHISFKFLTPAGIAELHRPSTLGKPQRLETGDEVEEISLDPSTPERTISIGTSLPVPLKGEMVNLLKNYQNVFVWIAEQDVGAPHHLMLHEMNVDPRAKPVKQKRRYFGPKRNKAVAEEINKLLPVRMIKEVQYPT
ncbi:uncharacterized protein LOC113782546 [Coffea eugenioides]|uniref:uncharacterized protein LOC113782546 n=1 Tax=Coffea eugenioides TaxID=49369 RepID=UPI000F60DE97|nr:uncharacterized protein LOC113782546 [Coffea eugenioides]